MASRTIAQNFLTRLEAKLAPDARRALRQAFATMRANLDETKVAAYLAQNDIAGAVRVAMDSMTPLAQRSMKSAFGQLVEQAAGITWTTQASALIGRTATLSLVGSPRAADAVERLALQFFPPIFKETETVLRGAYADGLTMGLNPRTVAATTKDWVGLTAYDYKIARSFRGQLERSDYSAVLGRTLRDARSDSTILAAAKEGARLAPEKIQAMTERYTERLQAWRSETWARTATLNAAREGQHAAWGEAIDALDIERSEIVKTWVTTLDGREREEHHAADGTTVPFDDPFPVDGGVMTPGDGVYNCRCAMEVRVVPLNAARRDAFLNSPSRQPRGAREASQQLRAAVR